jgi:hypothetical protein
MELRPIGKAAPEAGREWTDDGERPHHLQEAWSRTLDAPWGPRLGSVTPPAGCQVGPTNPAPTPAAVIVHSTQTGYYFTIQPAKIPAGDMVRIAITTGSADGSPGSPALPALFALLVHDSPGCGF